MDIFNDPRLTELIAADGAEVVGTCPHCGHDVYPSQLYPGTDPVVEAAYGAGPQFTLRGLFVNEWVRVTNPESPYYNCTGRCIDFNDHAVQLALLRSREPVWFDATEVTLIVDRTPTPPDELR